MLGPRSSNWTPAQYLGARVAVALTRGVPSSTDDDMVCDVVDEKIYLLRENSRTRTLTAAFNSQDNLLLTQDRRRGLASASSRFRAMRSRCPRERTGGASSSPAAMSPAAPMA